MGSSVTIKCKECNYTKSFITGAGMMYSTQRLMDFESEFALLPDVIQSKKTVSKIKELLSEHGAVIADNYGHRIYHCTKCGEFHERFFIHLDYDDGSFEVDYKCPKCKANLSPINKWEEKAINLKKYPCPKCGKHGLYEDFEDYVLWD